MKNLPIEDRFNVLVINMMHENPALSRQQVQARASQQLNYYPQTEGHSGGQWAIEAPGSTKKDLAIMAKSNGILQEVARVWFCGNVEYLANANLIALAPQLLEDAVYWKGRAKRLEIQLRDARGIIRELRGNERIAHLEKLVSDSYTALQQIPPESLGVSSEGYCYRDELLHNLKLEMPPAKENDNAQRNG